MPLSTRSAIISFLVMAAETHPIPDFIIFALTLTRTLRSSFQNADDIKNNVDTLLSNLHTVIKALKHAIRTGFPETESRHALHASLSLANHVLLRLKILRFRVGPIVDMTEMDIVLRSIWLQANVLELDRRLPKIRLLSNE
jgi:hypothetical protein